MALKDHDDLEFWREFVELYRGMPSLWKVNSEPYKNKTVKFICYEIMQKKLKEIEPHADIPMVKRKLNTLRSNYRREVNKVERSKLRGGPVYTPTVWYYDIMRFLDEDDNYQMMGDEELSVDELETLSSDVKIVEIEEPEPHYIEETQTESPSIFNVSHPTPLYKKRKLTHNPAESSETRCKNDLIELACDKLREFCTEDDLLSKYWANELKYIDPDQKLFAQKAINDILFEARMKTLHRNSVQINQTYSNGTTN
uniref:CSON010904 protein n=1 Tax=Culicoides sonorensis TaxID=179676 RepID=A0A336M2Q4_CULSO